MNVVIDTAHADHLAQSTSDHLTSWLISHLKSIAQSHIQSAYLSTDEWTSASSSDCNGFFLRSIVKPHRTKRPTSGLRALSAMIKYYSSTVISNVGQPSHRPSARLINDRRRFPVSKAIVFRSAWMRVSLQKRALRSTMRLLAMAVCAATFAMIIMRTIPPDHALMRVVKIWPL